MDVGVVCCLSATSQKVKGGGQSSGSGASAPHKNIKDTEEGGRPSGNAGTRPSIRKGSNVRRNWPEESHHHPPQVEASVCFIHPFKIFSLLAGSLWIVWDLRRALGSEK